MSPSLLHWFSFFPPFSSSLNSTVSPSLSLHSCTSAASKWGLNEKKHSRKPQQSVLHVRYYISSTGHDKQSFTQIIDTILCVCLCVIVHVCILHHPPTQWQLISGLPRGKSTGLPCHQTCTRIFNIHTHTHTYTGTGTLRSAVHKLLKHAVTANRQRGSTASNMGVCVREEGVTKQQRLRWIDTFTR